MPKPALTSQRRKGGGREGGCLGVWKPSLPGAGLEPCILGLLERPGGEDSISGLGVRWLEKNMSSWLGPCATSRAPGVSRALVTLFPLSPGRPSPVRVRVIGGFACCSTDSLILSLPEGHGQSLP